MNLIRYEDGADFNEANWGRSEYLNNNMMYSGYNAVVNIDGELIYSASAAKLSVCVQLNLVRNLSECQAVASLCLCGITVSITRTSEAITASAHLFQLHCQTMRVKPFTMWKISSLILLRHIQIPAYIFLKTENVF